MERIYLSFFSLFLLLQIIFWYHTEHLKPKLDILPKLQSEKTIKALSFGDEEFYFRNLSIRLQNSGDRFGHYTSLKKYDYELLYNWLITLSKLNPNSKFPPAIAAYFYSSVPDLNRVAWIVKYLEEYADSDIDQNWWWMFQALTLSKMFVKDDDRALNIAYKLSQNNNPDAPFFTKQMPAIIHSKMGDHCQSYLIMNDLIKQYDKDKYQNNSKVIDEILFMNLFIKDQLQKLNEANFDPRNCKI
ncbi:hypothetical protein N8772_01000 [Rickettsiales bacterium]|nr:hypothetical protein [Rickettsiales bacterium]MDB2550459.1 hypothetical protein [Rickettsiales bacterium]